MTAFRMYRVQNGTLLPLVPTQDAPQPSTETQDARQTGWERDRAYRALQQAEERLEMYGRPDMAREVRTIRARLALGR